MVYILDTICEFVEKIRREYSNISSAPMKITPILILLLHTLLYVYNLQQIFNAKYWHALPAAVSNIGIAMYLERHPEVQRRLSRFFKNEMAKVVSEGLILWVILMMATFAWMYIQGLIYRFVRLTLVKMSPPPPAPLAFLWQPVPTWPEIAMHHSDSISLMVALVIACAIFVVGLQPSRRHVVAVCRAWTWICTTEDSYPQDSAAEEEVEEDTLQADGEAGTAWQWQGMKHSAWPPPPPPPPPPTLPDFIPLAPHPEDLAGVVQEPAAGGGPVFDFRWAHDEFRGTPFLIPPDGGLQL